MTKSVRLGLVLFLLTWTNTALGQVTEQQPYVSEIWTRQFVARIQQSKRYPPGATNDKYAKASVSVTVGRDGNVASSTITETSGYPELDAEALALINRSQPFPRFPPDMRQASTKLQIPIGFEAARGPSSQRPQDQTKERELAAPRDREDVAKADDALREAEKTAKEKGTAYAAESGTQWSLDSKRNEMTDRTDVVVRSIQNNGRGAVAEIEGNCFKPGILRFTALIVDERGKPTIGLPTYSSRDNSFFGNRRVNADQATPITFAGDDFQNKFVALALLQRQTSKKSDLPSTDSRMASIIESVLMAAKLGLSPQPLETTWRTLVAIDTTAGPVLLKIPLFDKSVRSLVESCMTP